MNSTAIKTAFANNGIKVRVKVVAHGGFRVCTLDRSAHDDRSQTILTNLGCIKATGAPGGIVNQPHEIFTKAPGVVRVIR